MLQHAHPLPTTLMIRTREALISGVSWAFIGVLYGILFVFFSSLATEWNLPFHPYVFSGVLAGTIGALIYSSMRLAVLMAIIISPVCAILMLFTNTPISPLNLLIIIGGVGGIAGGLYGRFHRDIHVDRTDARTLAGFTAGLLASLGYLLCSKLMIEIPMGTLIAIMCLLTGLLYISLVPIFIRLFSNLLASEGNGALVGIGVAVFLTLCNFVMVHSIDIDSTGAFHYFIHHVQDSLPHAIAGGLIGGGLAGITYSMFYDKWHNHSTGE